MQKIKIIARWSSWLAVAIAGYVFLAYVSVATLFLALVGGCDLPSWYCSTYPSLLDYIFGPVLSSSSIWRLVFFVAIIPVAAFLSRKEFMKGNFRYSLAASTATLFVMIVALSFF